MLLVAFLSTGASHGRLPSVNVPSDRLTVWLTGRVGGCLDGSPKDSCCHYLRAGD